MNKYTLPSGKASIETEGNLLSETIFTYQVNSKNEVIEELLQECLKFQTELFYFRKKYPHPYPRELEE